MLGSKVDGSLSGSVSVTETPSLNHSYSKKPPVVSLINEPGKHPPPEIPMVTLGTVSKPEKYPAKPALAPKAIKVPTAIGPEFTTEISPVNPGI